MKYDSKYQGTNKILNLAVSALNLPAKRERKGSDSEAQKSK